MFTGKVIIVTGAAGNVGSALAALLASRGARIAAVDTARDRLEAVTASLSGSGHLALADYDLTDPAAADALVAKVLETCGRLDGVGTTVGGFAMAKPPTVVPTPSSRPLVSFTFATKAFAAAGSVRS